MLHITSPHSTRRARTDGQTQRQQAGGAEPPGLVTGLLPHTRTRRRLPPEQLLSSEVGGRGCQADLGLDFWCQDRLEGHGVGRISSWKPGPRSQGLKPNSWGLKGGDQLWAAAGFVGRWMQQAPSWLGSLGQRGFLQRADWTPCPPRPRARG